MEVIPSFLLWSTGNLKPIGSRTYVTTQAVPVWNVSIMQHWRCGERKELHEKVNKSQRGGIKNTL